MLTPEEKKSIIDYRRQKAYDNLNEAREVAKLCFWNLTGNRLYYAAFHMASALLLDKGLSAKSHGGLIHLIGSQFVTKGLLDKTYGRLFSRLYELRQSGDYDDLYDATEEEVLPYIEKTEAFIREMENLISIA
ncbi:MAG: HEPN domain-containing protein [Bacteroides sp]|nr:HEPN domain-containing protein [Bacteroides sp.]